MKKIGKTNKFISADIYKFSSDKIRNVLCEQDPLTLTSKLKNGIKLIDHKESFVPSDGLEAGYYRGYITLKAKKEIASTLDDLIKTSKIIVKTIENPEFLRIRNEQMLAAASRMRNQIDGLNIGRIGGRQIINRNFNVKISDFIDVPANTRIAKQETSNVDASARFSGMVSMQRLARDAEKFVQARTEPAKPLEVLRQFDFKPLERERPFIPKTIEVKEYGNSPFFNIPVMDVVFTEEKHYEEVKDVLNYVPPTTSTGNPKLDLRAVDNILKFKVGMEYNFLVRNYEQFLNSNPNIPVWNLPYFYEILEFKNSAGNIPELSDYDGVKGNFAFKGSDTKDTSFFNNPKDLINLLQPRRDMEKLVINSKLGIKNELVSIDKYLKTFNPYKEQFPMYTEIKIDVHEKPSNNLSDLFHEYNLYSRILLEVMSSAGTTNMYARKPLNELSIQEYRSKTLTPNSINNTSVKGYLLNENFIQKLFSPTDPTKAIINDPTIFFKFNSRISNLKRDFKQILNGEECYNEIIGYNLQKFQRNSSTLLQEWYLPNVSDDYLEWIDTQVKFGEEYTYKLNLLSLTVGNVYQYSNWENPKEDAIQINGEDIKIYYTYKPQFFIYTIPNSAAYNNILLDKPPVPPDLEIIPYVNLSDQIKINLNTGIGKFEDVPVSFNPSEEALVTVLQKAQNRIDDKIIYESDEPSEFFEIYRTDFYPTSYKEMLQGDVVKIQTNGSTAASYDDNIKPNTKYYYIARSIDYHGKVSNPTKIFQVELVNENGAIYPIIQVVDFNKKDDLKQDIKTFRKYLKVFPAMKQKIVENPDTTKDNFKLGPNTDSVWNKNMKIRLTSKQTGRKIDLNFKFKYDINK
jgi:hypothetical protein